MRETRSVLVGAGLMAIGVALGAIVFRSEPADAQTAGYRTCVFGHQETHDIDGDGLWERGEHDFRGDRIIRIPPGWEVVGAGGAGPPRTGLVLICRR